MQRTRRPVPATETDVFLLDDSQTGAWFRPLEERRALFDFIVAQLRLREALAPHRIHPLRVALQRQRDDVLGFARVLDDKLATIAQQRQTPLYWVQRVCRLHRKNPTSTAFWQRWNERHARLGARFVALAAAFLQTQLDAMKTIVQALPLHARYIFDNDEIERYLDTF